jgi:hypothetical protein
VRSREVRPGDALAGHDGPGIDAVLGLFVGGDGFAGDVQAEVALGLHHGDPEFALEDDAALRGPDGLQGGGGVAFGEDVRNHGGMKRFRGRGVQG